VENGSQKNTEVSRGRCASSRWQSEWKKGKKTLSLRLTKKIGHLCSQVDPQCRPRETTNNRESGNNVLDLLNEQGSFWERDSTGHEAHRDAQSINHRAVVSKG